MPAKFEANVNQRCLMDDCALATMSYDRAERIRNSAVRSAHRAGCTLTAIAAACNTSRQSIERWIVKAIEAELLEDV